RARRYTLSSLRGRIYDGICPYTCSSSRVPLTSWVGPYMSQSWVLEVKSENRISENQWLASFNFPVFGSLRQSPFDTPMHESVGYANRGGAPSYFPLSALTDRLDTRNQFYPCTQARLFHSHGRCAV